MVLLLPRVLQELSRMHTPLGSPGKTGLGIYQHPSRKVLPQDLQETGTNPRE